MKRISLLSSICLLVLALPMAAQSSRIYVLNNHGDHVDVIDPATNKVVQKIEGVPHSHGVAFSQDSKHAYITSETEDALFEVDTATGKVLRKVALSPGNPNLPALTADGKTLFVCVNGMRDDGGNVQSSKSGFVDIIDVASLAKTKTIPMPGGMHDCYTTPDGKYIVATSLGGQFISLVDPVSEKVLWKIDFDHGITTSAFELNKDRSVHRIFSGMADFHGFVVVDFATHKEVQRVELPKPDDFRVTGDLVRRNHQPIHGAGIAPDGKTLWEVSRMSNGVFIYSLPDLKVIKFIPTPVNTKQKHPDDSGDPGWICFTPDGKTAYIPNAAIDTVTAIDTKSMKAVAEIPVGRQPDHVETLVLR
jgi:YVTN family beta-propeller protein